MAEVLPSSRRRASRSSRAVRALVALVAVCLVAAIGVGGATLLSAGETRRLCDAAVSEGVATAAAANTAVTEADAALAEERRGPRAAHDRAHGTMLAKRVASRTKRVVADAWVPRCTSRDDVTVVRAQTRTTARSAAALDHAVRALQAAHSAGRR
ncbi:MAG: hypothetical protein EOO67_07625 [Microbacterium sp.]|nr:MAG: hypothetical protein EOO67_07625 [Microbacterium sp.]